MTGHQHHWKPTNVGIEFWACSCGTFSRHWWPEGRISLHHQVTVRLWRLWLAVKHEAIRISCRLGKHDQSGFGWCWYCGVEP
jgi:hypothetical protein